jgi:hypothetical protein
LNLLCIIAYVAQDKKGEAKSFQALAEVNKTANTIPNYLKLSGFFRKKKTA